ncbi:MAG: 3'-5' exonuclease [Chitinophagaceae bacterium]|nr:MAG: 3'-5' exonuclease [Chitinophagaceae bacterium]
MNISPGNILFLDIETVPQHPSHSMLTEDWKALWQKKADILLRNNTTDTAETIYERAGIYAEFGKIICISCGVLQSGGTSKKLVLKSFAGDDEKIILAGFTEMLNRWSPGQQKYFCAHNGKEFDFPYICRRMVINCLPLPPMLNIAGKKPWDVPHIDTLEMWKFGDFKSFTSLSLLAGVLGIATPKDDIDGSMVADVYWKERNLPRIVHYCQKDVVTVAQVYLRLVGETCIEADNIEIKE